MNPTDPEPNAFDALLDQLLKGEPVDADRFLETHPELSQDERRQVRFLTGGSAPREDGAVLEAGAETGVQGMPRVGGFRLLRRIGAGGMGAVYLAEEAGLGRQVAVKILGPDLLGTGERAERFLREARAIARLRHPNIVTVHAAGEADGLQYMAMEYIPGASLQEVLALAAARGERPKVREVLRFGVEIARALACAHEAGIVHRDVKPSNIRISDDRRAMLLDFGLAHETGSVTLTEPGAFRGSPRYASPEQVGIRGVPVDARTDVYSLGATLYEALTGAALFRGETREQLFHQILESEPVRPRRLEPALSRDLETVLLAALEKDPARRHPSASALAGDLESLLAGRAVSVRPVSPAGRLLRWARRTPAKAAVAVLIILGLPLVAGLGGYILANLPGIDAARAQAHATRIDGLLQEAYLELGESDGAPARPLFEAILRLDPECAEARAGVALSAFAMGDAKAVLVFLDGSAHSAGDSGWAPRIRAAALRRLGRKAKAARAEAALLAPVQPVDHLVAGLLELQNVHEGRKASAAGAFLHLHQAVLAAGTAKAVYHHELGHAAWHAGRCEVARLTARAIERLWPESPHTAVAVGRTLFDTDRDAAVAALETAARRRPLPIVTQIFVGALLSTAGRHEPAVALLREAVARAPGYAQARRQLAEVLKLQGDLEGAIVEFRESLRLEPRDAHVHVGLAKTLYLSRDYPAAVAAARDAVAAAPDRHEAKLMLGVALKYAGELEEAVTCFREAVRMVPDDPDSHCFLGDTLVDQGEFRRGLDQIRAGLDVGARNPLWKHSFDESLQAAERLVAAENRLEEILRGVGGSPAPEELFGLAEEVCRRQKRYAAAARLCAEAMPAGAETATGDVSGRLVGAATFAVRAGFGEGVDAPSDEAGRAALRQQAWKWFDAYLAGHERRLERGAARGLKVRKALACWTADPAVARLRDPEVLAGLPGSESAAWRALWVRLDAVLERLADE